MMYRKSMIAEVDEESDEEDIINRNQNVSTFLDPLMITCLASNYKKGGYKACSWGRGEYVDRSRESRERPYKEGIRHYHSEVAEEYLWRVSQRRHENYSLTESHPLWKHHSDLWEYHRFHGRSVFAVSTKIHLWRGTLENGAISW